MYKYMNGSVIDFLRLSPAELAYFVASYGYGKRKGAKPAILSFNVTLIFMIVLAEGFVRIRSKRLLKKHY